MGIPALGALSGLMIGNWQQQASIEALTTIYRNRSLLHSLESEISKVRLAKTLGPHVSNVEAFQRKGEEIQSRLQEIKALAIQLESSEKLAAIAFIPELKSYQNTLNTFSNELERILLTSQTGSVPAADREQQVLSLAGSESFSQYSQFADRVAAAVDSMDKDTITAQNNLEQAERLRTQIIVGSIIVSVIISSILARITIQTIARPLESLTSVAEAVSRDGNTQVRADVITKDEIGKLAIALNQLIDWVNAHTQDLTTNLEAAQLQLIQAEKMSSVGQLVAGVAHEINNPVNFISGNLTPTKQYVQELLEVIEAYQTHYSEPPEHLQRLLADIDIDFIQKDLLKIISSMKMGTTRICEIVLSLRNFSRLDETGYKKVDIHEGIENTLLILEHRLKGNGNRSKIKLVKAYGDLPCVECLPGRLNQVFMNLLSNAIDVLDTADNKAEAFSEKTLSITTRLVDSEHVQVEIADTGKGITEEVRSQIFEPFFTTKPVGKGTGLGLSISYQIVTEQHGGKMTCCSTPGKGTQFLVEIPLRAITSS
ncbi:MAG: ATP-binding protein [Phormidesmis sp.]